MCTYRCTSHRILDFDHYLKEEIVLLLQQTDGDQSQSYLTVRLNLADIPAHLWACDR